MSGGIKYDQDKPDFSMISYDLMEEVARVRMFGAKKYSRNNWMNGFKVTRSCAASLRHIFLFLSGETNDSESGLSHLAHAVCCLEHAIYDMRHHPENDDRGLLDTVPSSPVNDLLKAPLLSYNEEEPKGARKKQKKLAPSTKAAQGRAP